MKRNTDYIGMFKRRLAIGLAAATLALCQRPVLAEDIDLFVQPQAVETDIPNVLILLDNTANWNTPFTNEIAALVETVNSLEVNDDGSAKFRVGLMLFTETGSPNNNIDGGYVRAAVRDFTAANKTLYMDLFNSLHVLNDKSNSGKASIAMMEAYYYFAGQNPRSGGNKVKTDYAGNNAGSAPSKAIYDLGDNALPQFAASRAAGPPYNSPVQTGSCSQNFIIYISNNAVQDNSSDATTARNGLALEGGDTTTIPVSPSGSQSNMADEWARFMEASQYGITTYTIDVNKLSTGQGPGWTGLLKSMATVSKGKYFDVSSAGTGQEILDALKAIFSEIQAVNTVFASVSLPVSVNTEGTFLNQIYIGMFRPDQDAFPRWMGNLKQYKLGIGIGGLETQDADSVNAINSGTGFITECARSFWTPTTVDSYWSFSPAGSCLTVAGSRNSNYPDGSIVEKGAQAYTLRAPTTGRTPFKTCSASSCTALLDFNSTNVSQSDLGAATTTERDQLIDFAQGLDVDNENNNATTATTTPAERRPSVHGDVVHSRPLAVNMGNDASPQVVVFYGGNDGLLRAINGNRTADIGSVAAGNEMWAFMPPEFFPHVKRLRDNTTPIDFFGNTFTSPLPKPYGVDGPLVGYRSGSTLWLYASLRRGGRSIYAFDVSTINTAPTTGPTLKWKKGCPNLDNDIDCTTGFEEMGQSWSAPKIMKTLGFASGTAPLLILGGGYDSCEDADPNSCDYTTAPAPDKGNRIYVLDADTGAIETSFTTERGVVSDVFVLTDHATGIAKWAYAADLGGNIYRISGVDANTPFEATAPADWTMTKIASLGCDAAGCSANRKFMMPLDIIQDLDGSYVILAGSGDREKPLRDYTAALGVENYMFKIVDRPEQADWLTTDMGGCTGAICDDALLTIATDDEDDGATDPDPQDVLDHPKGWRLQMRAGEQIVTSAITVFGTVTFSTHVPANPDAGACTSNLGTARVYNIAYSNAASRNGTVYRNEVIVGGGLPPSPVAGMVTLDDGTVMPFLIGGDGESPLAGSEPVPSGLANQPKNLQYWYIHK
jgi:type IV pilus assembly protein PilY1